MRKHLLPRCRNRLRHVHVREVLPAPHSFLGLYFYLEYCAGLLACRFRSTWKVLLSVEEVSGLRQHLLLRCRKHVCATFTWGRFSRLPIRFWTGIFRWASRSSPTIIPLNVADIGIFSVGSAHSISGISSLSACFWRVLIFHLLSTSPCRFINCPPPVESSSAPLVTVPTSPPVSPSYGWSCGLCKVKVCPRYRTSYCSHSCARLRQLTTWSSALVSTSNAAVASVRRHILFLNPFPPS